MLHPLKKSIARVYIRNIHTLQANCEPNFVEDIIHSSDASKRYPTESFRICLKLFCNVSIFPTEISKNRKIHISRSKTKLKNKSEKNKLSCTRANKISNFAYTHGTTSQKQME